jgi:hypothetical protein
MTAGINEAVFYTGRQGIQKLRVRVALCKGISLRFRRETRLEQAASGPGSSRLILL